MKEIDSPIIGRRPAPRQPPAPAAPGEADAPPPAVSARLQDPLLDGALHLFALVTQQEGMSHDDALDAVREQLQTLAPGQPAERLTDFFDELLKTPQRPEEFCAQLRAAASYGDRVYILLKVLEFRCHSRRGGPQAELSTDLLTQIGVQPGDFRTLLAINNGQEATLPPPEAGSLVRVLPLTDRETPGALWMPVPGLHGVFITVGRTFYVVCRSEHALRIGGRELPADVFLRVREDEVITLAGRGVTVPDLRYYFRQASRPQRESDLYVHVADHRTVVSHLHGPESELRLTLSGVTPVIQEIDPTGSGILEVNGQPVKGPTPVWLNDAIFYRRPLDLRKMIAYAQHDTFVFEKPGDVCAISNDPHSPVWVLDVATRHWGCRLESTDGGLHLLRDDCPHSIRLHGRIVSDKTLLKAGDILQLARTRLLIARNADGALEVTARDDKFSTVEVCGVSHRFAGGATALDNISFELQRGDLVCVLGPSGCGKSTLLNVLNGSMRPAEGDVRLDGVSLFADPTQQARIGFVPQDDLLQENLTVRENLFFAARLRWPHETVASHRLRVDNALRAVDLGEQHTHRVGGALDKSLSGGQRKRVNIGLELVGPGSLLLLDEPTSGLSSGDTRKIVEVLRRRADNGNIILVVAHQPSARVLAAFDKVLVLDKGGRLAFFGTVAGCYQYFGETLAGPGSPALVSPEPGLIFEALEQPKLRIDGSLGSERRYPPTYWQGRYRALVDRYLPVPWRETETPEPDPHPAPERTSFLHHGLILLARECLNKVRGRIGLVMQLLSAAFLGFAAAFACRVGTGGGYSYRDSQALLNYMFLTVIVCLFLAVSGSVQEIIRDRAILLRERMLDIPFAAYLLSKFVALLLIYACQLTLYLLVGFWILQIPELWGAWWLFLIVVGCAGIGLGLAISAVPKLSERAAAVLVPLVIIPQIILSGAEPFPFSAMRHLRLHADPGMGPPGIAQVMPSRWALEGLVALHRDHGFARAYREAKDALKGQEAVAFRIFPDGSLKQTDPAAYKEKYAQFEQAYLKRCGKPVTPERIAFYYTKKSGETADPQKDPGVRPLQEKKADAFDQDAAVQKRFAYAHRVPFTGRAVAATGFDAAMLGLFAAGFLGLAGLLNRFPAFFTLTARGRRLLPKRAAVR